MQLSNQPAEALAKKLVDTSGGAFTLCGFASGGLIDPMTYFKKSVILTILCRIRSYGKRFEVGQTGVFLLYIPFIHFVLLTNFFLVFL
jgi:hypothetical protein